MSEDRPIRGDVLPMNVPHPLSPTTPPPQVGGPTFWVRWRYTSAREKAEAYTQFLRSLTETVGVTEQLERAIEKRDAGLARLERLGDLREAEHHKIDGEVASVKEHLAAQRFTARATLAALEEQAVLAEKRLARAQHDSVPQKDETSPARRAAALIMTLRAEQAEIIKEMKAAASEGWTEADEDTVHRMELALNDRINRIIQDMRDA